MLKVSVFGAALLLAGCVSSGVVFEDEPIAEAEEPEPLRTRGLPICPPGHVEPPPPGYVTCITPRPEPRL